MIKNRGKDEQTYHWAGLTLTWGMYVSFGAMAVGLAWWFLAAALGGQTFAAQAIPLDRILPELFALNPLALLNLGVILLLATPGITLLAELFTFAAARNWRFAGITAIIGAILLLSLALSLRWIVLF